MKRELALHWRPPSADIPSSAEGSNPIPPLIGHGPRPLSTGGVASRDLDGVQTLQKASYPGRSLWPAPTLWSVLSLK